MPVDNVARALARRPSTQAPNGAWRTIGALTGTRYGAAVSTDGTRIYVTHGLLNGSPTISGRAFTPSAATPDVAVSDSNSGVRAYAAGVWCNGRHWSIGGANGSSVAANAEAYTPAGSNGASGSWADATYPPGRAAASAAAIGTFIYLAGGTNTASNAAPTASGARTEVMRYDTTTMTGSWTFLTSLPAARYGGALVAVGSKLYYLGGFDSAGSSVRTVYVYDTATGTTGTWSTLASSTWAFPSGAVAVNGMIYLINPGGVVGVLDPSTGTSVGFYQTGTTVGHGNYPRAVALDSTIYYISGDGTVNIDALDTRAVADLAVPGWTTRGTTPASRSLAAISCDGSVLYMTGGYVGGAGTATGITITAAGAVTAISNNDPQGARQGGAGVWCNGKHYVFGGTVNNFSNGITGGWAYTPAGSNGAAGTWGTPTSMPVALIVAAAAAVGTTIYVAGGWTGTSYTSTSRTFLRYDITTGTWTDLTATAPLPMARSQMSMVAVGTKLYVFGGQTVDGVSSSTVFVYDTTTGTWRTAASLPTVMVQTGAAVINSIVYLMAGSPGTQAENFAGYAYDTATETTAILPNYPVGHFAQPGVGAIGSMLMVAAGGNTSNIDFIDPVAALSGSPFARRIRATQQYLAGTDATGYTIARRVALTAPAPAIWKQLATLPTARYGAAVSTDGTIIYALLGSSGGEGFTITSTGVVTAVSTSTVMQNRVGAAGAYVGGKAFTFGGYNPNNNVISTQYYVYNPAGTNSATGGVQQGFMGNNNGVQNTPRAYASAAALGGFAYLAGGRTDHQQASTATNTLFRLDPATFQWTTMANMPAARAWGAMVALNGKLYYLGGNDTNGIPQPSVFIFDPTSGTWSTSPVTLFEEMDWSSAAVIGSMIYVTGRYFPVGASGSEAYGTQVLDVNTGAKAMMTPPKTDHVDGGSVVLNGVLHLISGQLTANVDVIDPISAPTYVLNVRRLRAILST